MRFLKYLPLICAIFITRPSFSAGTGNEQQACVWYSIAVTCSNTQTYTTYGSTENANSFTAKCYENWDNSSINGPTIKGYQKYITDITCKPGWAKQEVGYGDVCLDSQYAEPTSVHYYKCSCAYTFSGDWSSSGTGIQRQSGTYCGTQVYQYRCASGYYAKGSSPNLSTTSLNCTRCPANATCNGDGLTSFTCNVGYYKSGDQCVACEQTCGTGYSTRTAGATSASSCRSITNISFTDVKGTFRYTNVCCCGDDSSCGCSTGFACWDDSDCSSTIYPSCNNGCCGLACWTKSCTKDRDCFSDGYGSCNTTTGCCDLKPVTPIDPDLPIN